MFHTIGFGSFIWPKRLSCQKQGIHLTSWAKLFFRTASLEQVVNDSSAQSTFVAQTMTLK